MSLLFNVVAGPGALRLYRRDGALRGSLARHLVAWTLPGVIVGAAVRVFALPGPGVSAFLLPIGTWLCLRTLRPARSRPVELSADGADRARSLRRLSTPKSLCFRLLERDAAVSGVPVWPCYRVG